MDPTQRKNFSILAQLESVQKAGELIRHLEGLIHPKGAEEPDSKKSKRLIQNGGLKLNPHQKKFQRFSSIRKSSQIRGTEM